MRVNGIDVSVRLKIDIDSTIYEGILLSLMD